MFKIVDCGDASWSRFSIIAVSHYPVHRPPATDASSFELMRERIFTLVEMNDQLAAEKAKAAAALKKAVDNVAHLQDERSELLRKVNSMLLVSKQRDHLDQENLRLLMEKRERESR